MGFRWSALISFLILLTSEGTPEPFRSHFQDWLTPVTSTRRNYQRREIQGEPFREYFTQPLELETKNEEPFSKIQKTISKVEESLRSETKCQLNKVELKQGPGSAQYIEYAANIPSLKQFHFCIWIKSKNLTTEHTLFSYSALKNPDMITMWISPFQSQAGFHLVINGVKVYNVKYTVVTQAWIHFCQSWNGNNGQWGIFVDGESVGDGYGPQKLIGFTIPGGGKAITGQGQDRLKSEGSDQSQGIQGEITLFEMHDMALPVGSKGSALLRPVKLDCLSRRTGNLVSWGRTHLKLFGGAEIYGVRPICASFPEE